MELSDSLLLFLPFLVGTGGEEVVKLQFSE